ncbi:hypothetical protein [Methanooceanicella nereidis]|uniref:hypothetical protein n=1 Tax=Methanooceanicella nereidis TaxID=2052831 RepID=UPI001E52C9BE|nr:hypothetical protein [Methanocella sp. CWC-04]
MLKTLALIAIILAVIAIIALFVSGYISAFFPGRTIDQSKGVSEKTGIRGIAGGARSTAPSSEAAKTAPQGFPGMNMTQPPPEMMPVSPPEQHTEQHRYMSQGYRMPQGIPMGYPAEGYPPMMPGVPSPQPGEKNVTTPAPTVPVRYPSAGTPAIQYPPVYEQPETDWPYILRALMQVLPFIFSKQGGVNPLWPVWPEYSPAFQWPQQY